MSNRSNSGKVKFFDSAKGYGFIKDSATSKDIFVHANDLEADITAEDIVEYNIGDGKKGPIAKNVIRSK